MSGEGSEGGKLAVEKGVFASSSHPFPRQGLLYQGPRAGSAPRRGSAPVIYYDFRPVSASLGLSVTFCHMGMIILVLSAILSKGGSK